MALTPILTARSQGKCELCEATKTLHVYAVQPQRTGSADESAMICESCFSQLTDPSRINTNHWRCLATSMWSEVPAVKVISWRLLHQLRSESWALDLLEQMYLDDDILAWAKKGLEEEKEDMDEIIHVDSNGAVLQNGDTVVIIKDLEVKGAGFTAKRGTAVRNISLVEDNPEQITGRVNGTQIFLLTKFLKKST